MHSDNPRPVHKFSKIIQQACATLTQGEQGFIVFLASFLNPDDENQGTLSIPAIELEHFLVKDSPHKEGTFYSLLDKLLDGLTNKKISFPSEFSLGGASLKGRINWIASAVPKFGENGILYLELSLAPPIRPFLLWLKDETASLEFTETARLKSGFSIYIYQWCKSSHSENAEHGRYIISISIDELKRRLGVMDKYPDFRNFRRKVLDVAKNEINQKTSMRIEYGFIKEGRRIAGIRMIVTTKNEVKPEMERRAGSSKPGRPKKAPAPIPRQSHEKQMTLLTEAQNRALNALIEFGTDIEFALDKILPIIKGSELVGYEDYFATSMIAFFTKKTASKDRVKTFAGWVKKGRFEDPKLYAHLIEQVIEKKKKLKPIERANRELAKNMTAAEFRKMLKEGKGQSLLIRQAPAVQKLKKANISNKMEKPVLPGRMEPAHSSDPVSVRKFDFEVFKKEHPDTYKQIRKERSYAFAGFKSASNYKQLLDNSIKAYCEQWFKKTAG